MFLWRGDRCGAAPIRMGKGMHTLEGFDPPPPPLNFFALSALFCLTFGASLLSYAYRNAPQDGKREGRSTREGITLQHGESGGRLQYNPGLCNNISHNSRVRDTTQG